MWTVYCLKLQENKYYVGRTREIHVEIKDFDREIDWLKRYRPVSVLYTKNNCTLLDEKIIVENEMKKHGIINVRGGNYSSLILSDEDINIIRKKILSQAFIRPSCTTCGKVGHYCTECIEYEQIYCYTCGKVGHTSTYCDKDFSNDTNILEVESDDEKTEKYRALPYEEILNLRYEMGIVEQDEVQRDEVQRDEVQRDEVERDDHIDDEKEYDFCDI